MSNGGGNGWNGGIGRFGSTTCGEVHVISLMLHNQVSQLLCLAELPCLVLTQPAPPPPPPHLTPPLLLCLFLGWPHGNGCLHINVEKDACEKTRLWIRSLTCLWFVKHFKTGYVHELLKQMLNYKMLVQISNILYCVRVMAYQVHMGISFKWVLKWKFSFLSTSVMS